MIDLPDFSPLRITQSTKKLDRKQVDALDHVIAAFPEKPSETDLRRLPKAAHLRKLLSRASKKKDVVVTTHIDNAATTAITLATYKRTRRFETLTWARRVIAECSRLKSRKLGIVTSGLAGEDRDFVVSALVAAADAVAFELPSYKSKSTKEGLRSIKLLAMPSRLDLEAARAASLGNNIARWLTVLPPNKLTAPAYRSITESLAKRYSLDYEFIDIAKLRRLKAGAFLAVAQGNASNDAGIVRLSYRPAETGRPALALVGKGILFDTGGTNLKPFKGMLDMHTDMQGSAVALGTGLALAERNVNFAFDIWLAVTENRISATAYKSQDIVVAANGTSIQVIHTDAEGRMVLADTLTLAARKKPELIIDYATLTGACIAALTTRYSGVFTNRRGAYEQLIETGISCGERVWPFPLDDDFEESLQSNVADIKQCAADGSGDHILAARFLKRFVPEDIAWVHMDLSAGQHKGGLANIPTEITGFGVAYTLELLGASDPATLAGSWAQS